MVKVSETNACVTSSGTVTAATYTLMTMTSTAACNGRAESVEAKDVSPSTYQMLLQQVESLRKENSTLKAELKNNTSHISKLENEALRMKDMVLMLGSPGLAGGGIDTDVSVGSYLRGVPLTSDDISYHAGDEAAASSLFGQNQLTTLQPPMKLQNSSEQDGKRLRPEFLLGLPQNFQFGLQSDQASLRNYSPSLGSVSPSPTMAVADVIRKQLQSLNAERASILRSLNLEEQKKKYYLKQLTELTGRLDNVSESDKFTKPSDETRKEIEIEIVNLKKTMDQSLGSSGDVMQERLKARLDHIHLIENEIASLEQHLRRLEIHTPCSPSLLYSHLGSDADTGTCTQHASYRQGGLNCTESSSQTPKVTSPIEGVTYEEEFSSYDNSGLNLHVAAGGGKMSRAVQTVASCLAGQSIRHLNLYGTPETPAATVPFHDPTTSRSDPKAPGSIDSLPSQSDIDETASMHSFTTSLPRHFQSSSFGRKKDGVHSPSFLRANKEEFTRRFLKMGKTVEGCFSMKQSNFIPLIVQIIHDGSLLTLPPCWTTPTSPGCVCSAVANALKTSKDSRTGMMHVLRNIIHVAPDAKLSLEILNVLDSLHGYCEHLFEFWIYAHTLEEKKTDNSKSPENVSTPVGLRNGCLENGTSAIGDTEGAGPNKKYDFRTGLVMVYDPPIPKITAMMKYSCNEALRGVINELGGLYTVAELFILHCRCIGKSDLVHAAVGSDLPLLDERRLVQLHLLRRLIGFSLINLTYGDMTNKAVLIQMQGLIDTVLAQMAVDSEEMQQVFARVVRNLSWQPDETCREILRQKKVVTVLVKCAMKSKREDTLKSVLSALWNLSGHCPENRASICSVKGALAFLVSTLTYRTAAIVECGGGILRNVSSVVATNEEYRQILREHKCLHILLTHLKAARLTIVSNACGTLWNLSARDAQDQKLLWDLGAVPMLKNLVHSKHSVIAQGSTAALRNLLTNRPGSKPSVADQEKKESAKLKARKQKGGEFFEMSKTPTEQNFSPRHHAQSSGCEKLLSPRSALSPQRHSLQETSSSTPGPDFEKGRRFQKGALHYSGSLGSLPSTEFADATPKSHAGTKYVAAARNCNSYPNAASNFEGSPMSSNSSHRRTYSNSAEFTCVGGGMLKDVMMFNDVPQPGHQFGAMAPPGKTSPQSNMSLRQCFKLIANSAAATSGARVEDGTQIADSVLLKRENGISFSESLGPKQTRSANTQPGPGLNPHSPYYPRSTPSLAWGPSEGSSGGNANAPEVSGMRNAPPPIPQAHGVQKLLKAAQIPNVSKIPNHLVPNCPEDLVKRLHDVEDDYDNDDGPVNYSLQYRDEHMTPGIQSPRTEEIYESCDENGDHPSKLLPSDVRQSYMHSQMSATPSASLHGPATKSEGGLSGLSSCIESTGSSAPGQARQDAIKSGKITGPSMIDGNFKPVLPAKPQNAGTFSAERSRVDPPGYSLPYDDIGYEDEKPTNFGAIYSEEQLYEPIQPQSLELQPYNTLTQLLISTSNETTSQEPHSVLEGNSTRSAEVTVAKDKQEADGGREEDDKFDMGGNTPAQYFHHHRSGRNSGIMTPRTPLEDGTPMMFSRSSSLGSVSEGESIHSSITSEPGSRMMSGRVSPSHLPDSPSQSMPVSPRRSPPPISRSVHPLDAAGSFAKPQGQSIRPAPLPPVGGSMPTSSQPIAKKIENKMNKLKQPGYISSMPHKDEITVFNSEGAVSEMTKFSDLTIDDSDKIQPLMTCQNLESDAQTPVDFNTSTNLNQKVEEKTKPLDGSTKSTEDLATSPGALHIGQRAVLGAGYVTSLPTNDEIKSFMHEGTLSPMTAFSEISCLQADNEGFQKSTGSVFSVVNSASSNKAGGSFASRSSATGASVPPAAPEKWKPTSPGGQNSVKEEKQEDEEDVKSSNDPPNIASPTVQSVEESNNDDLDDDSDSLPGSSSDEDDLLQQCIQRGLPKKQSKSSTRGASSKYSNRSRSSRSKEKTSSSQAPTPPSDPSAKKEEDRSLTNPSPEVSEMERKERKRINIKQKIESANMKLKGIHIVDYIDNLINKSDAGDEKEDASKSGIAKTKQVIDSAAALGQSYSVRKKLKEDGKQERHPSQQETDPVTKAPSVTVPKTTGFLPTESTVQSKMRIQTYIREVLTSYATEGTPVEMSRSTSLSNLTIDSEGVDNLDASALPNKLKASRSVPDIQSADVTTGENTGGRSQTPLASSAAPRVRSPSPAAQDSREILDVLEKQIQGLSLSTVESVITSEDPGYTRSLPHSDEIRKYNAEGSQFGGTEFSALTIDSDTKIAPAVPTDIAEPEPRNPPLARAAEPASLSDLPQNAASRHPPKLNTVASGEGDVSAKDVQNSTWLPPTEPQPSSHYNNDNDNLAMKEERRNYTIEDTPLNLSGPGSLSSLDFGSDEDNDLLTACITSALPPEKKSPYPPYPTQLLAAQQSNEMDAYGRYNHGVPDGKVDSPTAQKVPICAGFQTPNEEQWPLFQRETEELSKQLLRPLPLSHKQSFGMDDEFRAARASDPPVSSSVSLSQPTDGFYDLSRQASTQDSDLSIGSSVWRERDAREAKQKSPYGSAPRQHVGKKSTSRQQPGKHTSQIKTPKEKPTRAGKRYSPAKTRDLNSARKTKNQPTHVRDSTSGSSSSYQRQTRHRPPSNKVRSGDMCSCQVACSRPSGQQRRFDHGPVSASTSHLVDGARSPSRPRRKSTNSASKNSYGGVEAHHHHHHQPKPNRSRNSAKNFYRPSVTQLYPPLKDMVGVLEGVASVAARGDKVVADRNPSQYSSNVSKKSSGSSLVRSATFITENPSPVLLDSMTKAEKDRYASKSNSSMSSLSPSQSQNSSGKGGKTRTQSPHSSSHSLKMNSHFSSPRGSVHSLKAQSATKKEATKPKEKKKNDGHTKQKHNKVWSGIKKLLSPSEETSASNKDGGKISTPLKGSLKKESHTKGSKIPKTPKSSKSNPNLKQSLVKAESAASSLSLSSSSASNNSSDVDSTAADAQTRNTITPYGLLPKSPSVNAVAQRTAANIPQSRSLGILNDAKHRNQGPSVWRRTPPKLPSSPIPTSSNSGSAVADVHSLPDTAADSNTKSLATDSEDVWISKKQAVAHNQIPSSRIPLTQGQNRQILPGEGFKAEAGGPPPPGFQPPLRTQSPRVVQQVAPFNYKPSPKKLPEHRPPVPEKNVYLTRKIGGTDCKQTSV